MTVLFHEMTREQIRRTAPTAVAVLPTAAIEQHGPHLPVWTDSLLCETVARRAAERAAGQATVVVAPILPYGSSHHHFPFPGVLSLASPTFIAAVTDVLEGLVKSGFRRLVILNGHGGNSNLIGVIGQDMVNRLGHPVTMATADYWDIARRALAELNFGPGDWTPGHAGHFETALVMAVRPDLVDRDALAAAADQHDEAGLDAALQGGMVQVHGTWGQSAGYSDSPASATAEAGQRYLEIIVERVAEFFIAVHRL
jgi:creatinine amidohydrolase